MLFACAMYYCDCEYVFYLDPYGFQGNLHVEVGYG